MLDRSQNLGCGCERVQQDLMPLDSAVSHSLSGINPVAEVEEVPLVQSLNRTAAASVLASRAMPFFDNSAMDGFAVSAEGCQDGTPLRISATIAAGDAPSDLRPGTTARIYTGAPIPSGADAVIMSELSDVIGETVRFQIAPNRGDNIRRAGSDQPKGANLLYSGQRIAPRHMGLLAANGFKKCSVRRRVRIGVFSTGDELTTHARAPGQIYDANRPMLLSLCAQMGAEVTDLGVLADDLSKTTRAFEHIRDQFDLVLTSGAVSIGGRDHVRTALLAAGGTLDGWRVAIKPGKPVAFGRLGNAVVTGLPGNPFASFVGFHLFVASQIERLSGGAPKAFASHSATADFEWTHKPGRAEVFPVKLGGYNADGLPKLTRLGASVSATLFPLAEADGLAIVPAETNSVAPGDYLNWQPFSFAGVVQ
ncbi:molybdopterin molybdotransferase MoeA [Shimia sediminis]|uniref:molybdopterin molybdotransferase MoeA n=1 Tax=Shimia sediminis TaxID=2497945 RepID=UPI0013DE8AA2|nr:gephyrin-like molybdotransferase Glp [Shimia sediminis]